MLFFSLFMYAMSILFNIPYAIMVLCNSIRVHLTFSPFQRQKEKAITILRSFQLQKHHAMFIFVNLYFHNVIKFNLVAKVIKKALNHYHYNIPCKDKICIKYIASLWTLMKLKYAQLKYNKSLMLHYNTMSFVHCRNKFSMFRK